MLPALASLDDLLVRLGSTEDELTDVELARAQAALDDSSTLVRTEAGKTWVTDDELDEDIPDVVVMVTLSVARRGLLNPDGYRQETLGDHSVTYGGPDSLYLTDAEKGLIASALGNFALGTISTTRGNLETAPVVDCYNLDDSVEESAPWLLMQ